MSNNNQYYIISIQLIAFILSLVRYKNNFTFLLMILLGISFITECLGIYSIQNKKGWSEFIFQTYTFFEFNIITLMSFLILRKGYKIIFLIITQTLIFNLFWLYTILFNNSFLSYLIIIGSLGNSIYMFLYLRKLLISDEILNYKKLLPFWVSIGFLIFYLPSVPFFALLSYMKDRGLFFILNILIVLMNLFIIYGLITCNKKEQIY